MKEISGDFWIEFWKGYDACACTTNMVLKSNGDLVMGAGIAKSFAERFKYLPARWGKKLAEILKGGIAPGVMVEYGPVSHYPSLVAFPTKYHFKEKSSTALIQQSAQQLKIIANALGWKKILLTRPGCGMGGLDWEGEVKPILTKILDDRFYVIEQESN